MNQPPPGAGRSGIGPKLALAGASVLAGLALAEAAVRIAALAPEIKVLELDSAQTVYKRSDNPLLGFELKAGYRDPDADLSSSYPSTNAHGLRDVERSLDKPPGTRRILLLGDSVVEGHGIRDLDDTISRQLERLYDHGKTEVLNFGVSGYCTRAEVELLEVRGLRFDPDVVVLLFVINDFDNFNREAFRLGSPRRRPRVVEGLFSVSHLFRLAAVRLDLFLYGAETDPVQWNSEAIGDNNVVDGLRRLRELSDEHGFDVVVAVWPVFEEQRIVDTGVLPGGGGELIIELLARGEGFPVYRMSEAIRARIAASGDPIRPRLRLSLGDRLHPSVEGARIAALALKDILDRAAVERRDVAEPLDGSPAVEAARELGSARPDYSRVHNNEGLALRERGLHERAVAEFRRALEINPDFAEAHNNLANVLLSSGDAAGAVEHYRRALDGGPPQAEVHFNLGLALSRTGRHDEAIEQLREALRLAPDQATTHLALGRALRVRDRLEAALEHLGRAVGLDPGSALAQHDLGELLVALGRKEEALPHLERAVALSPGYALARGNLGRALAAAGRIDEAIAHLAEAVRLRPDHAPTRFDLARALDVAGREAEALVRYREALELARAAPDPELAEQIRRRLEG